MADRDAELDRAEQGIARAVSQTLDEVADEFAREVSEATELAAARWSVSGIARMWKDRVAGLVRRLLGVSEQAVQATAEDLGVPLPDGWDDLPGRHEDGRHLPDSIGRYVQITEQLLAAVGDRLAEAARRELATGLDRGEGMEQLRDRLRAAFARDGTKLGPGREERIAATEAARAWSSAALAAALAAADPNNPPIKTWVARRDRRTRAAHRRADGQQRPLHEPFDVGGTRMQAPGDPDAPSTLVVGCRCRLRIRAQSITASTNSQLGPPAGFSEPRETLAMAVTVSMDAPWAPRDTEWDSDAARTALREWATGEDDELDQDALAQGYVWRTDGPPSDWALPVATVIDGTLTLVWGGVTAAAGAVQGARSEMDLPEEAMDEIRGALEQLYQRAAEEFDDDSIVAPWVEEAETEAAATVAAALSPVAGREERVIAAARALLTERTAPSKPAASEPAAEVTRRALYAAVEQRVGAWRPEAAWFEPPTDEDRKRMEVGEQPLVSDDGRVLGYVATWRQEDGSPTLHLGYADVGEYVPVPKGQDYTYFHQRNINYPLSDGTSAHVGIITDHGHPSQSDNPQQQIAIVRVGEDEAGVWIAGAVFPDVRDNLMRFSRIKASAISGEWTSDGSFRGAAMVNHPGFPQSTAAGQDFYALAASLQAADGPTLESFRRQLLDMVETVTSLIEGQGQGDSEGEDGERGFPDGVDAELVRAALAVAKEGGLNAAASRLHGIELPPALTILANWLEETGNITSQQSRAASIKAAQAICRSPEKQHAAVRARACRLLSEYKAKGGK